MRPQEMKKQGRNNTTKNLINGILFVLVISPLAHADTEGQYCAGCDYGSAGSNSQSGNVKDHRQVSLLQNPDYGFDFSRQEAKL
jgi:hypothetical protein